MATPEDLRDALNLEGDSENKFDYLKAKYIFRFPFTWTAIKWGIALGSFFGLHQFIKTRNLTTTLQWFVLGNIFTGMPIWYLLYSLLTMNNQGIFYVQIEQSNSIEDINLSREYMIYKLRCNPGISEKVLIDQYQKKADELISSYNLLDELIKNINYSEFDLNGEDISTEQSKI